LVEKIRKMANGLPPDSRRSDLLAAADAIKRARKVVDDTDQGDDDQALRERFNGVPRTNA
jgi:hypothetical protein